MASPQIRNMGTHGGNLAQKVRCWYFRDADRTDCYKRNGSFCYASRRKRRARHLRFSRLLRVQPSDTSTALSALGASIVVEGQEGQRIVSVDDFFIGPDKDYLRETVLAPNELIAEVRIPAARSARRACSSRQPRASPSISRGHQWRSWSSQPGLERPRFARRGRADAASSEGRGKLPQSGRGSTPA